MIFTDDVYNFILTLKRNTSEQKKAEIIKNHILNTTAADACKSFVITNIKKKSKEIKHFENIENYNLLNFPEIYDKIFKKAREPRLKKEVLDIDIEDIKKILTNNVKNSSNFYEQYAYLLLLSGRRIQ